MGRGAKIGIGLAASGMIAAATFMAVTADAQQRASRDVQDACSAFRQSRSAPALENAQDQLDQAQEAAEQAAEEYGAGDITFDVLQSAIGQEKVAEATLETLKKDLHEKDRACRWKRRDEICARLSAAGKTPPDRLRCP